VSARSDVLAALSAIFAAIQPGASFGYVYTPNAVKRVQFFPQNDVTLDSSLTTIYLIRVERETHTLGPTSCSVDGVLETYVLMARRFEEATENPYLSEPVRCTTVDNLIDDAKEALINNPKLGIPGVVIDALSQGIIVERDFYSAGWAAAEMRLGIQYRYTRPPEGIPR
jgi:hypothetical protein